MDSSWDGSRLILGQSDLDEMEVLSSPIFSVGVPVRADPEFKAFVFAAAAAHSLGNRTVDGHLRREKDHLIETFSRPPATRRERLAALLEQIRDAADERIEALSALDLTTATEGLRGAANNLIRLQSTFRAASQLIRLGFAFEAEAVIRLGFEQVAWAQAVADVTAPQAVHATRVEHTVQRLKPFLPDAGRLYGHLSDLAHMAPTTHARFLGKDPEQRTTVGIQLPEATLESIEHLIVLLGLLLLVSEVRYGRFGISLNSVESTTDHPLATRHASRLADILARERATSPDPEPGLDQILP